MGGQVSVICNYSVVAGTGDTCNTIADSWGISLDTFESLNPGNSCPTVTVGKSYCVLGSLTTIIPSSTPTPTSTSSSKPFITVTTTTSSSPYQPTQSGLAPNCNQFYYVNSGDTCQAIADKYSISLGDFYTWNPAVGSQCLSLWAQYWVCVSVPGATHASPPGPTQTPSGPQPQMPGITASCNNYYMVQSGDNCYTIEQAKGITLDQLRAWNTLVDATCSNLWLGYYICVGV